MFCLRDHLTSAASWRTGARLRVGVGVADLEARVARGRDLRSGSHVGAGGRGDATSIGGKRGRAHDCKANYSGLVRAHLTKVTFPLTTIVPVIQMLKTKTG